MEGAEFGIIQAADNATLVSVSGGQNFTPDSHIDSDADGKVIFSDLSFGRCFIRETKPPNGFAKSNLVLQVDIEWADPANVWNSFTHITVRNAVTGAVIQRKGNGDIAVVNDRKSYGISFDKVDGSTGTGLVGAVFSITPFREKTAIL